MADKEHNEQQHQKDPDKLLTVSSDSIEGNGSLSGGAEPAMPDQIDDFKILEKIGEGGMGKVYRAYEKRLERVVALKILKPEIANNPSVAKRFRREAILAANLSHPNIVPVYHVDNRDKPRYFTMEFVQGRSLKAKVEEEGFLSPAEAVRICIQACDALAYAHEHNIIHRDIKPANILLQNHIERVRITDFGIAQDTTGSLVEVTQTEGLTLGTPAFMSPEQNLGKKVDHRTDIFSLGMTLYYTLTGRTAYQAKNRQELAVAFREHTPPSPSEFNPEVNKTLDAIILKMITADPNQRYTTAKQAGDDLQRYMEGHHLPLRLRGRRPILGFLKKTKDAASHRITRLMVFVLCAVILATVLWQFIRQTGNGIEAPKRNLIFDDFKELTLDLGGGISMKFVLIHAGKFTMGSPNSEKDRCDDEGPQHEVTISKPFYMGIYEVTQAQYEQIMAKNPSSFQGAQNPVNQVSWDDAVEFCKKLSQKTGKTVSLPTEAQWEYACRAGSNTRFSYGNDDDYGTLGDYAWCEKNSGNKTHPVGQKKPNAWGLYDMHGNVWEWCRDWYDSGYYAKANKQDPENTTKASLRVLRGSCWNHGPDSCRSAYRGKCSPVNRYNHTGFRVVVSLYLLPPELPKPMSKFEQEVRARIADAQLGDVIGFYRQFKDRDTVEAVRRWDAGIRVSNIDEFERKVVPGKGWQVVYKGTTRTVNPEDIELTTGTKGQNLIFDDFSGSRINDSLWTWNQTNAFSYQGLGKHEFKVSQEDGSLLIDARTEHERGWTAIQDVWVDSKIDLKKVDKDIIVEIEFAATAVNGKIAMMLSEGNSPKSRGDPDSVHLFKAPGESEHPLKLGRQSIQIQLLREAGIAAIRLPNNPTGQYQLVDVSKLSAWRLRFYASAGTSAGLPPDKVQLRLYHVKASTSESTTGLVGKVIDVVSNRPIEGATVGATLGLNTVTTNANGLFFMVVPSSRTELKVSATGYNQVTSPFMVDVQPGKQTLANILMRKTRIGYGDVEWAIPFKYSSIGGLAVTERWLYFTAVEDKDNTALYRMEQNGLSLTRIAPLPIGGALTFVDGELYGIECWPGRLYKIGPAGESTLIRRLSIDWPRGLAFDGKNLWFLETSGTKNRYGVYAIEPASGKVVNHFSSSDTRIRGVAWGNNRLWVSSLSGWVYEIDPAKISRDGKLESGIVRKFRGSYSNLSFSEGYLWGVDNDANRLCRIISEHPK